MALAFGAFIIAASLTGCTTGLGVVVTSIADPDADLGAVRTFDLAQTTGNDPLVEKNLLRMAMREMEARGYTRDAAAPDVLLAVLGDVQARREYVPPDTTYTPYYDPGDSFTVTSKRRINGQVVRTRKQVRVPGDWVYVPQTTPGYERTVFTRSITIRLLDAALGGAAPGMLSDAGDDAFDAVPIWEGRATNTGAEPDLLAVAPLMIREALGEFPSPSGKPSRRTVEREAN